jgi:hypothetical protein
VDNKANFHKGLDGKPLYGALYGMYTVILNELKTILKASAQAGQSDAVNRTSVESMAQNNFQEVMRCKRHVSNDTSQTAKKMTIPVPTSTAIKLPPEAVLTRNFFSPLRTMDMDAQTTGTESAPTEQKAPRKSGRLSASDDFYHKPHPTPKQHKRPHQRAV